MFDPFGVMVNESLRDNLMDYGHSRPNLSYISYIHTFLFLCVLYVSVVHQSPVTSHQLPAAGSW